MKKSVYFPNAVKPAGPYSPAVVDGDYVFVSGQGPVDPATGQVRVTDIRSDTALVCDNLRTILEAAGSSLVDVVKVNVYLVDINEWAAMNEVYVRYFAAPGPARTTIQAAALPRGFRVEIDCVARLARSA